MDRQSPALVKIKRQLDATDAEPSVQENVRRHYENLEKLAHSLRTLGMDDHQIDKNVVEVFKEYERELDEYMRAHASAPRGVSKNDKASS